MKTRLLVILGLLCFGLTLYYVSFEMRSPGSLEIKAGERIFRIDQRDISGIQIRGGTLIALVRKGQTWWVEGQVNFPADQEEVASLIRSLRGIPVQKTVVGRKEEFGLDKPVLEFVLNTSRERYDLFLGSDSPTSLYCYASMAGRKEIFLLPAGTKTLFRQSLFNLTDKYLIHTSPSEVSKVRVVKHGSIVEIVRSGHGRWHLAGSDQRKLGTERINNFFKNICEIKALSFPDSQRAPQRPDVTVVLTSSQGEQRMRLWKEGQKLYALSDYQRGKAEVSSMVMQAIPSGPDDLLDRSIVDLEGSPVRKIVLKEKGERVFSMRDGVWYAGSHRMQGGARMDYIIRTLVSIEYEDEYLLLPGDAGTGLRLRIYTDKAVAPFDIILYSQYYVSAGKRVFRINEGDMITLKESLHKLISENE